MCAAVRAGEVAGHVEKLFFFGEVVIASQIRRPRQYQQTSPDWTVGRETSRILMAIPPWAPLCTSLNRGPWPETCATCKTICGYQRVCCAYMFGTRRREEGILLLRANNAGGNCNNGIESSGDHSKSFCRQVPDHGHNFVDQKNIIVVVVWYMFCVISGVVLLYATIHAPFALDNPISNCVW